ncbi:MAG TPA: 16S rRNA (guanine(527)-N(7))-methyltransferase RsmG [Sphingomicrobium sp.]|nr:16S rRNA (guanine(527)-N(7))-methyltransferase RsmG [Sphingomicrobium sp.]
MEQYAALLREASATQNLIAASTLASLWERHILDSAQLVRFEPRPGAQWVDVGSGAGLPGIVLACLVDGPVTLIEPRRLRADFLRHACEALGLAVTIHCAKVERVTGSFDVITGRAVAPLSDFLRISGHLSTGKTVWALPKGRKAEKELAEARRAWQGVFHVEQSATDPQSKIVVGTGVRAK